MDTYIPSSLRTFSNINWNKEHSTRNTVDCNWLAPNINDHSLGLDTAYLMLCFWTEYITFPRDLVECTLMQKKSVKKKNFQKGRDTVQKASGKPWAALGMQLPVSLPVDYGTQVLKEPEIWGEHDSTGRWEKTS